MAQIDLGNVLLDQGRLEESEASYRRALRLKPDYAVAHSNLGNVLWEQGRLEEAELCCRSALKFEPEYSSAHSNLGNVLRDQGRLEEAESSCRRAIELKPDFRKALNNLGKVLQDQGKWEEAEAHYRRVLELDPSNPIAHNNLGNALRYQDRFEEAEACYRQSLRLNPGYALAHCNLGFALQTIGRFDESLECHRRAIALEPDVDLHWVGFAESLRRANLAFGDGGLFQDLVHLLERPSIRLDLVMPPIISALRGHQDFARILERSLEAEADLEYAGLAVQFSAIPLLLRIMELTPISDLQVEKMFTGLRRTMLHETLAGSVNDKCLPFSVALALHCFVNEYVFWETPAETTGVERLQDDVATQVRNGHDVPPARLIALAAYRPLYRFPWSEILLDGNWEHDIERVIARQIREPIEEKSLGPKIRSLTPIRNEISLAVREQYEENPYPRWVKTSDRKARTIDRILRGSPLRFDLGGYVSPESPEILVAGCGTGRHALAVAARFLNARVLALDLSLTSLSYAMRKTRELEVSSIEYAQADIMELGGLGREFDLIESSGVLHHLGDPLAGWRILLSLLRPGGLMKVALYSETARRSVVAARSTIAEKGYTTSSEDIRRFRHDLAIMDGNKNISRITQFRDFFSLSECRDLLFHVQEHRFTLPQIEEALTSLKLRFLGFEFVDQRPVRKFKKSHPESEARTSLAAWHEFELENPNAFAGMYQFWCRKL